LEVGLVVGRADRGDELPHFVHGEEIGEFLVSADPEPPQGGPVPGRGVGVEELDAAVGDAQRRGSEHAIILEMEEELADLLFGESIWRDVKVVGQLRNGAEIGLLSAFS
jgi:hypothetical protein